MYNMRSALCALVIICSIIFTEAVPGLVLATGTKGGKLQSVGATDTGIQVQLNGQTFNPTIAYRQGNWANVPFAAFLNLDGHGASQSNSFEVLSQFTLNGNPAATDVEVNFASSSRVKRIVVNGEEMLYLLYGTADVLQTFYLTSSTGLRQGTNTVHMYLQGSDNGPTVIAFSMRTREVPKFASVKCGLYPSGLGTNGLKLREGQSDPHWVMYWYKNYNQESPAIVTKQLFKLSAIRGAQYIAHADMDFNLGPDVCFRYRTQFDLSKAGCPYTNPSQLKVRVSFGIDDRLTRIAANGHEMPNVPVGSYREIDRYEIRPDAANWVRGKNTLEFDVCNPGGAESCAIFAFDMYY